MILEKLEYFTHRVAKWIGSAHGFGIAVSSIILWLILGKFFNYSNSWENALAIYIGVITFLMIFVMQRAQIKELAAVHIKLNELIVVSLKADNKLITVEELSEKEISELQKTHREIADSESQA